MRQVVLDTETTGLEPNQGHRIIEIGCVELINRRLSGGVFHRYLQPDRSIERGAQEVHGITEESLKDKPRFADIWPELSDFIGDAELIIHNAPFDVGFIDFELKLLGHELLRITDSCRVLDTLALARRLHPGQRNSLDALCRRYEVDNSQRDLHGALLDAEILADVYLAMTGGQVTMELKQSVAQHQSSRWTRGRSEHGRASLLIIRASAEELASHEAQLDRLTREGGRCVWRESALDSRPDVGSDVELGLASGQA